MYKMLSPLTITLFFYITGALTVKIDKCKKGDNVCLTKAFNDIHPNVLGGIPSLGVDSSDPIFLDVIEGNFPTLKYKYTNITVKGFKDCSIKNVILSQDMSKAKYEMDCPKLTIKGNYEISGNVMDTQPMEGKGTFSIITGRYLIKLDEILNTYTGDDNKSYLKANDFTLKLDPLETIQFNFKNLFKKKQEPGQKDLPDAAHNFAQDNWKKISEFLQEPTLRKTIDKFYVNYNKFMKSIPLDEFLFD